MIASLLALLASAAWGTSDFLAGVQSRRMTSWGVALIGQVVAALGSLVILAVLAPAPPRFGTFVVLLLGGVSSAAGVFAQYRALALTTMNVVSPIVAGAAIVPVLWGLAHGDKLRVPQLLGVVVTLLGIVLISRRPDRAYGEHAPVRRAGVLLALAAAAGFGLMLVALGYGSAADPFWRAAAVRCSATLTIGLTLGVTRPHLRLRRNAIPLLIIVGLLIVAANALFAMATTAANLSVVAVLGWLGPAVTIIWARLLLHERLRSVQWLAAVMVLGGVVCLAL